MLVLLTLALLSIVAIVELALGRQPICACGTVKLWHGVVKSAENSQQISDWYTFTHLLHGLLFYAVLSQVAPGLPLGVRFLLAVLVEGAWEIVENSPFIIDRYRAATISLDYYGDSVINSVSDVVAMMLGFFMANRVAVWISVATVLAVEVMLALVIRDNLTLNIIMLLHPFYAIKTWQLG